MDLANLKRDAAALLVPAYASAQWAPFQKILQEIVNRLYLKRGPGLIIVTYLGLYANMSKIEEPRKTFGDRMQMNSHMF